MTPYDLIDPADVPELRRQAEDDTRPDGWCFCGHDEDDHTAGNGCERRGCPCRWWAE